MNTNTHTAGLVDLASFQHLELKHCHLVLCSVYFWTHRWSFAIFRCTVKVDETLGQRLMFTLLNVLMSRLLRVETLRVSSGRASQDTLSLWTTVSKKKKKHTLLQTHCCSARLFWRSSALIWNIFYSFITPSSGAAGDGHRGGCFFFFFLKKCFCIDNKGTFSVCTVFLKTDVPSFRGNISARVSALVFSRALKGSQRWNWICCRGSNTPLTIWVEQSERPRLCTLLSSVQVWLNIFKWMWAMRFCVKRLLLVVNEWMNEWRETFKIINVPLFEILLMNVWSLFFFFCFCMFTANRLPQKNSFSVKSKWTCEKSDCYSKI